jgi:hypothetical protein
MTTLTHSREEWVDCARTLAMFFIIWLHAAAAPVWTGKVVGGAIALFFLLAGYFLPVSAAAVLRRTGRLAVAWAVWSLLSVIFLLVVKPYVDIEWQRVVGWKVAAYNTPLWFLKTLVAYQLVAAGLLALRLLPHYAWVLVVFLALCSYTTAPSQHLSVRFDYMWIFMLGFAAKSASLCAVRQYMWKHWWLLLLVVIGVFLQPEMLEEYADFADVSWRHCNLPLWNLAFMTAFLLVGVLLAGLLPRVAGALAFCGRWMLFIYAGHSYLLSPLYQWPELRWAWNVWVPVVVLPVMAFLAWWLARVLPRTMALLQAKAWR